jgi:hypothetical protein
MSIDNEIKYFWIEQSFSYPTADDGETVNENNITGPIEISCPKPDLQAVSISVSNIIINAGQSKTVTYEVKNIGDLSSSSSQFKFYLSKNNNLTLLSTRNNATINVNQTVTGSITLTIPSNTSTDSYSIVMKISTSGDSNVSNNTISSTSSFIVNGVQQYPDLATDPFNSNAKSSGASGLTQSLSSNTFHALYNGESLQINLSVKNNGTVNSSSMKAGIYVTTGSSFTNETLLTSKDYLGIISPNNSNSQLIEVSGSLISGYTNSNGGAYLHIVVDKDSNVNEGTSGGEDNNVYSSIPVVVYYSNRTSGKQTTNKKAIQLEDISTLKSYELSIYDFTGRFIKSSKVNSIEQENEVINELPSGLYIFKTQDNTRKISK